MTETARPSIYVGSVPRWLLYLNIGLALFYFSWWISPSIIGNPFLFAMLFIGEIYHVSMVLLFWFTLRDVNKPLPTAIVDPTFFPTVDVFVTVAGEPVEIVRKTLECIQATDYRYMKIFILNDSYVAGKANWQEYEQLAQKLGVKCLTRKTPGGAKAGNINHALRHSSGELVCIFDADMQPYPDFFEKTLPYFSDQKLAFVQTPQYYINAQENNVSKAAWDQQEFFFGPIMRGKQASNAAFICGTNVVIRRKALDSVGGMNETSIAEDFLTSLHIHQKGWDSLYIPTVLATGLAPEDLLSYYKQQLRWARGSVEVLFKHNLLFLKGLKWKQKLEYLSSSLYYCNGIIVLLDSLVPIIFMITGTSPIDTTTTVFALYFLPFITGVILGLHAISQQALTLRAISFTQSSWYLQLQAVLSAITGQKMGFVVTPKTAQSGNFLFLAYPHLAYIALAVIAASMAIAREGVSPAVITNLSWITFNICLSIPFILAAIPSLSLNKRSKGLQYASHT